MKADNLKLFSTTIIFLYFQVFLEKQDLMLLTIKLYFSTFLSASMYIKILCQLYLVLEKTLIFLENFSLSKAPEV